MAIIKYDPFRELEQLRDSIDRFFEEGLRLGLPVLQETVVTPKTNIYEEDNNLVVEAEIPGVDEDEINIEVHDDKLQIRAEHKEEKEEKKRNYYTRETSYGAFFKSIALPQDVDRNKAEATFKNGILKITLPKKQISAPKILKIKPGK